MGSCKMCNACQTINVIVFPPQTIHGFVLFAYKVSSPSIIFPVMQNLFLMQQVLLLCIMKNLLTFNPFPYDENKFLLNDKDLDPDINYWNNITLSDCNYVISSDLNALCSEHKDYNQFSIMHSNCRSIVKNCNSLLSLVNLLNHHISVIAVSELWTNKDNELFLIYQGITFMLNLVCILLEVELACSSRKHIIFACEMI